MKPFMFMFPPAKLRAALIFAAKDDIREYLQGLYFEPWRGGVVCVATDGHRLVAIHHASAFEGLAQSAEPFQFVLPRAEIERALKCQNTAHIKNGLPFVISGQRGEDEKYSLQINAHGTKIEGQSVEGRFPDFQRVIPAANTEGSLDNLHGFDARYLADYAKLAKALNPARGFFGVTILPNANSGARVCIGDPDVILVLMPIRTDGLLQPDWFYAPEEKREAA